MNQNRTDPRISLRPATPADVPALVALEHRVFSGDRLSPRQYARHVVSASAAVIVAVAHGIAVAPHDTAAISALYGKALLFFRRGSDIARLYSIAVAPEARGRGLGETLLHACELAARSRGCGRLRLEVRQDNHAAQRLYERLGYRRFGARAGYYEDGADAWRYEKSLVGEPE